MAVVTLAAPATGSLTVNLTSSSSAVGFGSPGVTTFSLPFTAGQTSRSIPLKYTSVVDAVDVVIRAEKPGELKVAHLGVVPNPSNVFSTISAYPRLGQVLLNWDAPDPRLTGVTYTISKLVSGTYQTVKTNWKAPYFFDTNASSTGETYKVVPVIPGKTYISTPANIITASATPGSTSVSLSGVPSGTASGSFTVSASGVVGSNIGTILIDGKEVTSFRPNATSSLGIGGSGHATIDTSLLSNGTHKIQAYVGAVGAEVATPEYTFTSLNDIQIEYNSGLSEPGAGWAAATLATLSGTGSYQIDILDEADAVIRTYTGSGSKAIVYWDGNDSNGVPTESGRYELRLTQGSATKKIPLYRLKSGPNFIALVGPITGDGVTVPTAIDDANTKKYARQIRIQMDALRVYEPYYDVAIFYDLDGTNDAVFNANLLRWMKNAKAFYYYGHSMDWPDASQPNGVGSFIQFGNAAIWPNSSVRPGHEIGTNNFSVTDVVDPNNPYHFVFMDTCVSAGGGNFVTLSNGSKELRDLIGTANMQWRDAFQSDCFVGWNGLCGSNTNNDGSESYWFRYRKRFWYRIGLLDWVSRALNYANSAAPPYNNIMPQDTNGSKTRLFPDGDVTLP
ncbi:hypothetical protein BH11ARM2_BH11ARM2_18940 [soil metagenome]